MFCNDNTCPLIQINLRNASSSDLDDLANNLAPIALASVMVFFLMVVLLAWLRSELER